MPKVWITKYALTRGIFAVDGEMTGVRGVRYMFRYRDYNYMGFAYDQDWHLTATAAIERAEEMRIKKIKAILGQIKKLEQMKPAVVEDGDTPN